MCPSSVKHQPKNRMLRVRVGSHLGNPGREGMSKGNYSVDKANEAVHYYQKQLFLIHEVHDASPLMYSHAMVKGMTK